MADIMSKTAVGHVVHVVVDERPKEAAALLARVQGVTKVDLQREDALVRIEVHLDAAAATVLSDLPNRLIAEGYRVRRFTEERPDLETAFMRLTKGLVS
jgi:hypothetical protein